MDVYFNINNIIKEVIIYSFSGAHALLMMTDDEDDDGGSELWAVIVTVSACIMQEIWRLNRYSQKLLRGYEFLVFSNDFQQVIRRTFF